MGRIMGGAAIPVEELGKEIWVEKEKEEEEKVEGGGKEYGRILGRVEGRIGTAKNAQSAAPWTSRINRSKKEMKTWRDRAKI